MRSELGRTLLAQAAYDEAEVHLVAAWEDEREAFDAPWLEPLKGEPRVAAVIERARAIREARAAELRD